MRALAGLSLLLIVGLLLGTSTLVYASYVLVLVFWISHYFSRRWSDSLSATRTVSQTEIEVGESASVQLRLDNRDRLPIVWVLIEDVLPTKALEGPPPSLELHGSPIRMCSVPAKGSRIVAYRVQSLRRGYFQIGPVVAETGDLLGLHRRIRMLTKPAYLLVLPKLIPLDSYDVASRRPVGEVRVSYRLMEDPTLVSGIRKYEHGDAMRNIHWRATARTGELQCKQYQPTSVAGATIVVDMHVDSNPQHHEPVRTDLAVTAAASIAYTLMHMQQQFGLISNGRDAADRLRDITTLATEHASFDAARRSVAMQADSDRLQPIVLPADRTPEHFSEIHKTLARLERTDGMRLESLLLETQNRMPRDATVLVILQEVSESAALALGMLSRQGYSVAALVNNYDNEAFTTAVGRLLAQRIAIYHLLDEESIAQVCQQMLLKVGQAI